MTKKDFIEEHKRLVKILARGSKGQQNAEAVRQHKELVAFIKKNKK